VLEAFNLTFSPAPESAVHLTVHTPGHATIDEGNSLVVAAGLTWITRTLTCQCTVTRLDSLLVRLNELQDFS